MRIFLLGMLLAVHLSAQPFTVRVTADNFYAVYSGTSIAATTKHLAGAWPNVTTPPPITAPAGNDFLYVVAWDDRSAYQGLLATVGVGAGFVPTGSPLWTVCATNRPLASNAAAAPTPASLTPAIAACNSSSAWHATSNGPNNFNALAAGFWGPVAQIDDTANWIWDTNTSASCAGGNGFLRGGCNPGEFLIFRVQLSRIATCLAPSPDFTIDWTAGYGMFVANGTTSQSEQSHFWSIQEADQGWNGKGPEINQWFVNQQAGVFDLKKFFEGRGQQLKCDKYYRVKLAVSNQCVNWRDKTQLVKLKCCTGDVFLTQPAAAPVLSACIGECGNTTPQQALITSSDADGCPASHCGLQLKILPGELCPNQSVVINLKNGSQVIWNKKYTLTNDTSLPGPVQPGVVELLPSAVVRPGDVLVLTAVTTPSGSSTVCKRLGNFRFEISALH